MWTGTRLGAMNVVRVLFVLSIDSFEDEFVPQMVLMDEKIF